MENRFCGKCGRGLVKKDLDSFNTNNGERHYHLYCPSNMCNHYGVYHDHDYEDIKISWLKSELRCKKCGDISIPEVRM